MFQVTDHTKMKRNLQKIDTYGISPKILKEHRRTIFWVRKVHEDETGQYALRFFPYCRVYDKQEKKYVAKKIDFSLAYWNPEMFDIVERR
jgi:hypothetical protein